MSKMMAVAAVAAMGTATSGSGLPPKWRELTAGYTFEEYKQHFPKAYADAGEERKRRGIFERNLRTILAHNADGSRSWKMGVNQFTDREPSEVPMGAVHNAAGREELGKPAHAKQHVMTGKPIPAAVDWRTHLPTVVSPVKNQFQCGDCWAFATIETVESHWALKSGRLWTLSTQQVTDCTRGKISDCLANGCEGGFIENGYDYLVNATKNASVGITSEFTYPFMDQDEQCSNQTNPTEVGVFGWKHVPANNAEALMDAVANVGPVGLVVAADPWFQYEEGVLDSVNCTQYPMGLDHAVVLDGYGTDEATGKEFWLIRNSWSPGWGENGYIRILRRANGAEKCGPFSYSSDLDICIGRQNESKACGDCGVLVDPIYPIVDAQ